MSEYEQLRAALDKKLAADPSLRAVVKRIKNGTATLTDSAEYARVLSHILGREVSANVLDLDDRAGVVTQLLRDCYGDVNSIYAQTQTLLDEQAGIHIRPQQPDFPAERVDQFTHSLIDPTVKDCVIKRRAKSGCETITKSYHDDCIKKNAQFRHDAGLKCYIVRIGTKCCEWCSDVAGKYEFGDQPDGIFRRHDNCDCTIIYDGQVLRGKQNANGSRSKTWEELPNANAADYEPTSFTQDKAKELERRNLAQIRGLKINNSSIDNSGGSGIIDSRRVNELEQAKKRDHKISITDVAIEKVPAKDISELTKEQNAKIYNANKSVLKLAKEKNESNEVAKLIDLFSDESYYHLGKESSVDILQNPNAYAMVGRGADKTLFLAHNHPSTQNFSYSDIGVLLRLDSLFGMSVVTNTGDVHILYKTSKYDFNKAYEYIKAIRSEYEVYNADIDAEIVKKFLKDSKSIGIVLI
ncbi:MAG: hypothetical protein J6P14_01360 [Ruminococcus sp.]|nr:hypothetical protein [Ruminococcus sp.]